MDGPMFCFFVGTYYGIAWLASFSGAYLAFLWLPVSPEKILTFAIAIFLLRIIFPNDKKTLAVLKRLDRSVKDKYARRKERKKRRERMKSERVMAASYNINFQGLNK